MCVCERERERERESVCVFVCLRIWYSKTPFEECCLNRSYFPLEVKVNGKFSVSERSLRFHPVYVVCLYLHVYI